jgi:hypothetical protein
VRDWAVTHPHEYFLVFGSPVPGYAAPQDTVGPGTRVPRALVALVSAAARSNQLRPPQPAPIQLVGGTADDISALRQAAPIQPDAITLSDDTIAAVLIGWMQVFGLISFELSNRTRGVIDHHRDFFETAARASAALIGLA